MDIQGIPQYAQSLLNMTESEEEKEVCPKCGSVEGLVFMYGKLMSCEKCSLISRVEKFKKEPEVLLKSIGIPQRYLNCSFDNFKCSTEEMKKVYNVCKGIDCNFDSSLFIHSNRPGTGKTHLAVSIIRNICEQGVLNKPKFISSPFLFLEIKNTFNENNEESEKTVIDKYTSCKYLFVDDIGVEKCSDWANQIWYMIIDSRYSQMKPTVYTSNLSIGEIASKIDPRIASRLASGIVLNLDAPDHRLKK